MRIAFLGNWQVSYSSESHHAKSLEALGHDVIRLQEPQVSADEILSATYGADLFVWIHTHSWETPGMQVVLDMLRQRQIPRITYHLDLYMPIQRWQRYVDHPYFTHMDHWFTVDRLMADWLNENTGAKGHFLPAGVFGDECYISEEGSPHANDVVFVGSRGYHPEWPWRPRLLDWLRDVYGPRFTHVGGDGDTGTLRGAELNAMYARSKVAVGDTLCVGFDYPYYASDRLFECPGRGGVNLFPRIKGLDEWFTEDRDIAFYDYGDFTGLRTKIDYFLSHGAEREALRRNGHQHVKANHTYKHRWQQILDTVFA